MNNFITKDSFKRCLKRKMSKSSGTDSISYRVLYEMHKINENTVYYIWELIGEDTVIPNIYKDRFVIFIPKGRETSTSSKQRSISIS